jgi:hypothetical protein
VTNIYVVLGSDPAIALQHGVQRAELPQKRGSRDLSLAVKMSSTDTFTIQGKGKLFLENRALVWRSGKDPSSEN